MLDRVQEEVNWTLEDFCQLVQIASRTSQQQNNQFTLKNNQLNFSFSEIHQDTIIG